MGPQPNQLFSVAHLSRSLVSAHHRKMQCPAWQRFIKLKSFRGFRNAPFVLMCVSEGVCISEKPFVSCVSCHEHGAREDFSWVLVVIALISFAYDSNVVEIASIMRTAIQMSRNRPSLSASW